MEPGVCLICLEESTTENKTHYNKNKTYIYNNIIFKTICPCNIYTHDNCMLKWISKNPCCLICNIYMKKTYIFRIYDIYNWFDHRRILATYLCLIKFQMLALWLYFMFHPLIHSTKM